MCGIVGFISLKNQHREFSKEKFMTDGLYVNALRGMHSTGVMSLEDSFRWRWAKNAVTAQEFIDQEKWSKKRFNKWCMVGHNRHATIGAIETDNAHPFHHGEIILVHNGTLNNHHSLPHRNKDIKVDSELVAYNLSKVAPEDAAKEVIGRLSGAYALVWFDTRDQSVNIVRNSERPMHFGINKLEDILWFMSEGDMLNMVTRRITDRSSHPAKIWRFDCLKVFSQFHKAP